jgi:hypothetical protein
MSLDIYLKSKEISAISCTCSECGNAHTKQEQELLFQNNITHNLVPMAHLAGLYQYVWRPEENGINTAADMIPHLEQGLSNLLDTSQKFMHLNPDNGWGSYDGLVMFIQQYLRACKEYPDALVEACR